MTGTRVIDAGDLPDSPVDAAAQFYARTVPAIREHLPHASGVIVIFEPAGHAHRAWRLAAMQELAREAAPVRVNAIVGADPGATRKAREFLERAPGVTGQILAVDGNSPGNR